jgi:hypothetical protein
MSPPIDSTQGNNVGYQVLQTVVEQGWEPVSDWRFDNYTAQPAVATKGAAWMDNVPTSAATVLGLDLLLQESCIDLRAASELVLSDVGATLQIMRLIAHEFPYSSERPTRMDDCLACLDVNTWFNVLSDRTLFRKWNYNKITSVWQHCRLVGQYAKLIAESLDDVSADEAYLVGLLHELDTLPFLLDSKAVKAGSMAGPTLEQTIPSFVLAALDSAKERGSSSVWRYILSSAHALAEAMPKLDSVSPRSYK